LQILEDVSTKGRYYWHKARHLKIQSRLEL